MDLLRLAILGKAVRRGAELEDLIMDVQSMAGAFWQPAEEVIVAGLQQLIADGDIRIEPARRPRHIVVVQVTPRGALQFEELMKREIRQTPEPMFHAVMMIKIALVDILPLAQRWRQVTALLERLQRDLYVLRRDRGKGKKRSGELACATSYARLFDEDRLEGEIRWLGGLAERVTASGASPHPVELTGSLN